MASRFHEHLGKLLLVALSATCLPGAGITASVSTVAFPGEILQGETFSTLYYYAADGMRYVFPDEKTYFTWYPSFDNVKRISDLELGRIQIGGNVTYKPGVQMVKIDSDPRTYAVAEGGMLRWIESEAIATALYGDNWATKINDLPDVFFTNYDVGPSIRHPDEYILRHVLEATDTIGEDKGIITPPIISLTHTGYSPIETTVEIGQSVRFVNNDTIQHTVTAENLLWGSGTLAPGAEFVHTFDSAGTHPFFDSYNSRNSGAVYVTLPNE